MSRDGLFPSPRARGGRHSSAYQRTLSALLASGRLSGDEHAATRALLRELAENADRAAAQCRAGDITPYALAMVVRTYDELLARHLAVDSSLDEALADFLEHADEA